MYNQLQQTQDAYESACRKFSTAHCVKSLVQQCGFHQRQTLSNKLNPEQPHTLNVRELITITQTTGDTTLVDGVLLELDMCAVRLPKNDNTDNPNLVKSALQMSADSGNLAQTVMDFDNTHTKRLSRSDRNQIADRALSIAKEAMAFMAEVDNRFHGMSSGPVFATGLDLLQVGAGAAMGL